MMSKFKIILGLGNPGEKYANTYHNAGRRFLDFLADRIKADGCWKSTKTGGFEFLKDGSLILIKPLGFMNESGKTAASALKYFNAAPENLIVVHDDSDIDLGLYKFSKNRGSAGHKGTQSIIDALKSKTFSRIRIGIRGIEERKSKAGDFVLNKISKKDEALLRSVFLKIFACYFESDDEIN